MVIILQGSFHVETLFFQGNEHDVTCSSVIITEICNDRIRIILHFAKSRKLQCPGSLTGPPVGPGPRNSVAIGVWPRQSCGEFVH